MVSPDPVLFLIRFWTQLPGSYTFQRHSHHTQLLGGQLYGNKDILAPSAGQARFLERHPTDPMFEREIIESSVISIQTVDGKQYTIHKLRVYRISKNGLLSIWNIIPGSPGIAGRKFADMSFRTETQYLSGYKCYPYPLMNDHGANWVNLDIHKNPKSFSLYHCVHGGVHGLSTQHDWYNSDEGMDP